EPGDRGDQRPWGDDRADRSDASAGQRTGPVRRRARPAIADQPAGRPARAGRTGTSWSGGAQARSTARTDHAGLPDRRGTSRDHRGAGRRAGTPGVSADAIAAHESVFGVLTAEEQQLLHDLLARVVEKGTGHALFTEHTHS